MSDSNASLRLPPALAAIRANKPLLFLLAGALGGAAGSVLAEFAPGAGRGASVGALIVTTGIWSAIATSVLCAALFAAGEWHQRRELRPRQLSQILLFGAAAGFLSGAVAQSTYSIRFGTAEFHDTVVRIGCWGLMGAMLGALLTKPIPNLGFWRGSLGGLLGGGLGGYGFILLSKALGFTARQLATAQATTAAQAVAGIADVAARLLGLTVLGLALGLAMIVVEKLFREASLEVIWAPGETTNFNLGAQAVTIGGGEDHVFVRGLPPRFASIVFANGVIEYVETASGARTPLKNGSRLEIGKLNLVIHAAK